MMKPSPSRPSQARTTPGLPRQSRRRYRICSWAASIRYALSRIVAERELAEERNLLRSVINNLLDSIYVKDVRASIASITSPHMRSIGAEHPEGCSSEKPSSTFSHHDAAVRFQADDQAVIRSGKPIVNRQEPFIQPDGQKHWLSTTKVPLRNKDGQIIGIVGIGRDITERKRSEEQPRPLQRGAPREEHAARG